MENGPSIDDVPMKNIYRGFSMAMLNNQMVNPSITRWFPLHPGSKGQAPEAAEVVQNSAAVIGATCANRPRPVVSEFGIYPLPNVA